MHTFAEKPKEAQQTAPAHSKMHGQAHFRPNRDVNSILHLQRTIGNQAVQWLLQQAPNITIQRAEVDEAATGTSCPTLADGSAALNAEVNRRLKEAYTALSARFRAANPSFVGPPSISGPDMVWEAFSRLGAKASLYLALIEEWSNSNLPHRGGGHGLSKISGTKYQNIPLSKRPIYTYLAPVVKLNNTCVGTDKIGHMFQQGLQYFYISQGGSVAGTTVGLGLGDTYARAWGEYMEGKLSPATRGNGAIMSWLTSMSKSPRGWASIGGYTQGYFGLATTGVHSQGDLAANVSGMNFYRDLHANPAMTFDISRYFSPDWSEQVSGNIYDNEIGTAVKGAGRLNPSDVVLP